MQAPDTITIALVDDHKLFRKGMVELINGFTGYHILWEANNGKELIEKFASDKLPSIVLLDITMPEMDGYETALWLKRHHPQVKVLALSMYDHEESIIRMLKSGASGYILKDADPADLKTALTDVVRKGFYYSDLVSGTLIQNMHKENTHKELAKLNERELEFLKLVCSELTYKEIADIMCVATRTVDGYREALFEKLHIKSRTGLVLYAIKHHIISVS